MEQTLLRKYLAKVPVKVDLEFGINSNIVLKSIDVNPRVYQGIEVSRNTFITFSQVNPITRKIIKEHEYSFFNLDHTADYVEANMDVKLSRFTEIVLALGKTVDELDENIEVAFEANGILPEDDITQVILTSKGAKTVDKSISQGFYATVEDVIGANSALLHFKTVFDKRGYLEIPRYSHFIEPMKEGRKTTLKVDIKEFKTRAEVLKPKTISADTLGKVSAVTSGGVDFKSLGLS